MRSQRIIRTPLIPRVVTKDPIDNSVKRYYVDKEELKKGHLVQISETEVLPHNIFWEKYRSSKEWYI